MRAIEMLVITRKVKESITIITPSGEVIVIRAYRYGSNKIRIGVEADMAVKIHRTEILNKSQEKNEDN